MQVYEDCSLSSVILNPGGMLDSLGKFLKTMHRWVPEAEKLYRLVTLSTEPWVLFRKVFRWFWCAVRARVYCTVQLIPVHMEIEALGTDIGKKADGGFEFSVLPFGCFLSFHHRLGTLNIMKSLKMYPPQKKRCSSWPVLGIQWLKAFGEMGPSGMGNWMNCLSTWPNTTDTSKFLT